MGILCIVVVGDCEVIDLCIGCTFFVNEIYCKVYRFIGESIKQSNGMYVARKEIFKCQASTLQPSPLLSSTLLPSLLHGKEINTVQFDLKHKEKNWEAAVKNMFKLRY